MNLKKLKFIPAVVSIIAIATIIFDYGFHHNSTIIYDLNIFYAILLIGILVGMPVRYILDFKNNHTLKIWIIDLLLWLYVVYLLITIHYSELSETSLHYWIPPKLLMVIAFSFSLIREISTLRIKWRYKRANPALLFVLSFAFLIIAGSLLLLLPNATYSGISVTDALFTATSAVCVTGLAVVDTGTFFTTTGQVIILFLIQLGGIGIMTFTNFFAYFFLGGASYKNLVLLGSLTSEEKISEVIGTLKKILIFTFLVEGIGGLLIYWNLKHTSTLLNSSEAFFAVFHSVSAFCNAGFSTLSNSFYDINFRFNYSLQFIIAMLIIIGGIGFPVMINIHRWLKHFMVNRIFKLNRKREVIYKPHIISLNTKLVFYTSLILIAGGTILLILLEGNNTLAEHHGIGKIVTAFFGAVTPRTAGFNTIDNAKLGLPALMLVLFLMWIGASPASTGGGIKTSTFALAILNVITMAKGKSNIELNRRKIPDVSLKRAFAYVLLSIALVGIITFLMFITEHGKSASDIVFEVVSAVSTAGLSRGITADLSSLGKYLIIFSMFIGRIGALTFLTCIMHHTKEKLYQYPTENILIN